MFISSMVFAATLALSLFFLHGFKRALRKTHALRDHLAQIKSLYPQRHFFGLRLIFQPENRCHRNCLRQLGLEHLPTLDQPQMSTWINEQGDIFLLVSLGKPGDIIHIQDTLSARSLFYAYETIVTWPVDLDSEELKAYSHQLALIPRSPIPLSLWLSFCERLPGYLELQKQHRSDNLLMLLAKHSHLTAILDEWLEKWQNLWWSQIPNGLTAAEKAEYLALPHQFKSYMDTLKPMIHGHLSRAGTFGYLVLIHQTGNARTCDHVYASWKLSAQLQDKTTVMAPEWVNKLKRPISNTLSLYAIYLTLSLVALVLMATHLLLLSMQTANQNLKKQSSQEVETLLFSEMASQSDPNSLMKLLALSEEMMHARSDNSRCERFIELFGEQLPCYRLRHARINALPEELQQSIKTQLQRLSPSQQIKLLIADNFSEWPTDKAGERLENKPWPSICRLQKLAQLDVLGTACNHDGKKHLIQYYLDEHFQHTMTESVPFKADDSSNMIKNSLRYFDMKPEELMEPHQGNIDTLYELAKAYNVDYIHLAKMKSLEKMMQQAPLLKAGLAKALNLLETWEKSQLEQQLHLYLQLVKNLEKDQAYALDPQSLWQKKLLGQLAQKLRRELRNNLDTEWQKLQHLYSKQLQSRFPFANSKEDASVTSIRQLLGPQGYLMAFLTDIIQPLIHPEGNTWLLSQYPNLDLKLNPAFIGLYSPILDLQKRLFSHGDQLQLIGTLMLEDHDPRVQALHLKLGPQSHVLSDKNRSLVLNWQASDSNASSELALIDADTTPRTHSSHGAFSPLRLLSELQPQASNDPHILRFKYSQGDLWVQLSLHHANLNDWLRIRDIDWQLPESILLTDNDA